MIQRQGDAEPLVKNVITLKHCAPIVGTHVMSFDTEDQVLLVSERVWTIRQWGTCV